MKPLKLTMQSFGSYGSRTEIDFTVPNQNLFLITGDTGAGKTTIFDALVFALYGEASSGTNKKDGLELQSQYTGMETEPFVELSFYRSAADEGSVPYIIHRVPRHLRLLKRGTGTTEAKEQVSLILPDGTQYSGAGKETDARIEEIVGLSKDQFMQVAMIAQGEFMELLRVSSDEKKVIFRRLFGTEIYRDIVEELARRSKEKGTEIGKIRTAFQTDASHIVVPEDYENGEELREICGKIRKSDRITIVEMESLLQKLEDLVRVLEQKVKEKEAAHLALSAARDERRDAYTRAESLLRFYEQKEKAAQILKECDQIREEIAQKQSLSGQIIKAHQIKGIHSHYTDAQRTVTDTENKLEEENKGIEDLKAAAAEKQQQFKAAGTSLQAVSEELARTTEQVENALAAEKNLKKAKEDLIKIQADDEKTKKAVGTAEAGLKDLEENEKKWQKTLNDLGTAGDELADWKVRKADADALGKELGQLSERYKELETLNAGLEKTKSEYARARAEAEEKTAEYHSAESAYLDDQAGFLASMLVPGKPCPVCGSTEHPSPCEPRADVRILTKEELERLKACAQELDNRRKSISERSAQQSAAAAEKASAIRQQEEALQEKIAGVPALQDKCSELFSLQAAESAVDAWKEQLEEERTLRENNVRLFSEALQKINSAAEQKTKLKQDAEAAREKEKELLRDLAAAKATIKKLQEEAVREFPDAQAANAALQSATDKKNAAQAQYDLAEAQNKEAQSSLERSLALIREYSDSLPGLRQKEKTLKEDYENSLLYKDGQDGQKTFSGWQEITEQYPAAAADRLQKEVNEHEKKEAGAQSLLKSSEAEIAGRPKPDLETLGAAKEAAEQQLAASKGELDEIRGICSADLTAWNSLSPKMEERAKAVEEYGRIERLYNHLAGKMTGARMDIETYVQRYYLQRILYAANRRFEEMSAGQYELRMIDLQKAGEGKNHGLDLMVYSAVTGKEREIRTLSGGESFMAALSLALGMADQIRESASAVSPDVMFIDEGFGSLDDHSRGQAVRVLHQMVGSERMVGIISHVTELKQQIEDQLVVTKDDMGSHVKWQIS